MHSKCVLCHKLSEIELSVSAESLIDFQFRPKALSEVSASFRFRPKVKSHFRSASLRYGSYLFLGFKVVLSNVPLALCHDLFVGRMTCNK